MVSDTFTRYPRERLALYLCLFQTLATYDDIDSLAYTIIVELNEIYGFEYNYKPVVFWRGERDITDEITRQARTGIPFIR